MEAGDVGQGSSGEELEGFVLKAEGVMDEYLRGKSKDEWAELGQDEELRVRSPRKK